MGGLVIPERGDGGELLSRSTGIPVDDNHRVRHKGIISGTIAAGGNADLDWKMEQLTYQGQNVPAVFVGVDVLVEGGNFGDTIDFCVIDIDNILGYGANFVLDAFGSDYYIKPNDKTTIREYKADMLAGLYIRAHYKNNGTNEAKVFINVLRYAVTA